MPGLAILFSCGRFRSFPRPSRNAENPTSRRKQHADENKSISCYLIIFISLGNLLRCKLILSRSRADFEQPSFLAKAAFHASFWKLSIEALYIHKAKYLSLKHQVFTKRRLKTLTVIDRISGPPCARRTDLLASGFRQPRETADLHRQSNEHQSA